MNNSPFGRRPCQRLGGFWRADVLCELDDSRGIDHVANSTFDAVGDGPAGVDDVGIRGQQRTIPGGVQRSLLDFVGGPAMLDLPPESFVDVEGCRRRLDFEDLLERVREGEDTARLKDLGFGTVADDASHPQADADMLLVDVVPTADHQV